MDWWWPGATSAGGEGPPPALSLPQGAPTTWYLDHKGCRWLRFQPGDGPCGCTDWSDDFQRSAMGDQWEVASGTWTTAEGVGLTPTSDGMLLAMRSARTRCHPLPAFWLSLRGTVSKVRLYFDYLDEDNHHYVEVAWVNDSTPAGGAQGDAELSIYRVADGEADLLAGPEDLLGAATRPWTIVVQFARTGVDGEVYVQALFSVEDQLNAAHVVEVWLFHQWVGCTTTLLGNRFGFAVEAADYVLDPPVIQLARRSDCLRAAVEYGSLRNSG